MTLDQCIIQFGNRGALAGAFGGDLAANEAQSAAIGIAESLYTPSFTASRLLLAELETGRRELEAAENDLAGHLKVPRIPEVPQSRRGFARRIVKLGPFRWLVRFTRPVSPKVDTWDRKKTQLEARYETARRRYLSLQESVGKEQQRAVEEARQADEVRKQAIREYERILVSEFEMWKVRSHRVANRNRRVS